jgi:hypothetical protein
MRYHFDDQLGARDCKRHIPHVFDVPAGNSVLDIVLRFAPYTVLGANNMLTLTLFDPEGFRGAGHRGGDAHRVHITVNDATPGYHPGPLPPGRWTAQIDTHMIMPGETVRYTLDIEVSAAAAENDETQPVANKTHHYAQTPPSSGPGWYRGDLHTHTYHSDADDRSVGELVEAARQEGLDFIFLTDHNTESGLREIDASNSARLLTAGGIELTTFWGHAVCLGMRTWIDWRVRPGTGEMAAITAATDAAGDLFIISHPEAIGDPYCTGCKWRFGDMMPGNATCVEIWNGPWGRESNNQAALDLWYDWLNQGRHMVATAGSDSHGANDYPARPGFNVVHAGALTEQAIIEGIRAGHLYMTAGPRLTFAGRGAGGETWGMGDVAHGPVALTLTWADCPPHAFVRIIANGRLLHGAEIPAAGEHHWRMAPAEAAWVVAEIRDSMGDVLAITNPIYLEEA